MFQVPRSGPAGWRFSHFLLTVFLFTLLIWPGAELCAARLYPEDLEYRGAFRLPGAGGESGWGWSGNALAYRPDGDPGGPADGYPGSLFGTGHDWYQHVSEITIPPPVISPNKNLAALNTAATLQPFTNIRGCLYDYLDFELPRAGLAVLPARAGQTTPKLYFSWGQHLQQQTTDPCLGWRELALSSPPSVGVWRIGNYLNQVTTDYLFTLPQAWADAHVSGMSLAAGRYQDGGQGAQGPALLVCAPWQEGNPPASGRTLNTIPLLLYDAFDDPDPQSLTGYHHSDEWSGGAWLAAGEKSAVIFAGTKGFGDCWYGCADGTSSPPWPPNCDRGWWSTTFEGTLLFYDPADLEAVAVGRMAPSQPQPYASLNIDDLLYHISGPQQKYHLNAVACDRERGLLYVLEPLTDNDKPIVHVWQVVGTAPAPTPTPAAEPVPADYDGDGASDPAVFLPSPGVWTIRELSRAYWGRSGDIPVPADFDGDGSDDIAVYRPTSGLWAVRGVTRMYYGRRGDIPAPGDFAGNGTARAAVYRPGNGFWAVRGLTRAYYGRVGDTPVTADYNGNGRADIAVFRPSAGLWAVRGVTRAYYGRRGDTPVGADYNGDGKSDFAVFRESTGFWAVRGVTRAYWGKPHDQPVPGCYDGTTSARLGIYRASTRYWFIRSFTQIYFGDGGGR